MRRILFCLGAIATLASAQVLQTDLLYVNGGWQRLQQGGADALPSLQVFVSSQAGVVLRGVINGSTRVSFRLIQRSGLRSREEADRRLSGTAFISNSGGMTVVTTQGATSNATLELSVPPQVRMAKVQIVRSGDIEAYNFRGDLLARSQTGDIQAENVSGAVAAFTGGGNIRMDRIGGKVECSTGVGSIAVGIVSGDLNCQTAAGEISVRDAQGSVLLSTGGGNITVDRAARNVEANSVRGAIQVNQAGGMVTANARGGQIRVGSAAAIHAESADGPVHVSGVTGVISVSAAIGSILAELMVGARLQDSSLVTSSGDITVMIPSNLKLHVMATDERGGVPRLDSDFPNVRQRMLGFRRPPVDEAVINGGGSTLLLSGSGTIHLRRIK